MIEEEEEGPTGKEVLALQMRRNEVDAETIREYLVELLVALYDQEDDFKGETPFGDFDWIHDLHTPLIIAGMVKATIDNKGYIVRYDKEKAHEYIFRAIYALGV